MLTKTNKPLLSLTAADLMSREVTAIPQHMSLRGAAHVLAQFDISGAPVVNEEGRCVGVLSAHDFLTWAEQPAPASRSHAAHADAGPHSAWQMMEVDALPVEEVAQFMTPDPVTVAPGTSLGELAGKMRDAHIHRVIVVDAEDRPIGVVSSGDVLAAVAEDARHSRLVTNW